MYRIPARRGFAPGLRNPIEAVASTTKRKETKMARNIPGEAYDALRVAWRLDMSKVGRICDEVVALNEEANEEQFDVLWECDAIEFVKFSEEDGEPVYRYALWAVNLAAKLAS